MNRRDRRRQAKLSGAATADDVAAGRRLVREARAKLEAGDLETARGRLADAVDADPRNAEAHHLLAMLSYQTGELEAAGEHILAAATADETDPALHANCAAILSLLGRGPEAEAAARHAISLDDSLAEAHASLGVALEMQDRIDEARTAQSAALMRRPGFPQALINLGNLEFRQGRLEDAVEAYAAVARQDPDNVMAHTNLAVALRRLGMLAEARTAAARATAIRPEYAEGWNALGQVEREEGDLAAARAAFERALEARPGYVEGRVNLAGVLFKQGDLKAAEAEYRKAQAYGPGFAPAHSGLGVVLLADGRLDDAKRSFERAIEADPGDGEAWVALASAEGAEMEDARIADLETLAAAEQLEAGRRASLNFALAEVRDAKGEHDAAIAAAVAANRLRRAQWEGEGYGFDADAFDADIERVVAAFPAGRVDTLAAGGDAAAPFAFVVGLPRSGTTLVEQILASHPQVRGAGELDLLPSLLPDYPEGLDGIDAEAVGRLTGAYAAAAPAAGEGERFVVDKTPLNFLYLGLLRAMFPAAPVVHVRRDADDVALSCFLQDFKSPHVWATDVADIRRFQAAHDRLMRHWHEVLSGVVVDVAYEDIVRSPEQTVAGLLDALGLDWDDRCLRFHEQAQTVLTASNWQVRRPLYAAAVGRAAPYRERLDQLARTRGM